MAGDPRSGISGAAWPEATRAAALAVLALVLAVCFAGCKPETNTFAPPPPPEVTVAHPAQKQIVEYLEYTGTTEPFESVDLRARVTGFLEEVRFKPGSRVSRDDILFVIDKRPFQAVIDRLQARILADEAAWKAAESDARIAEELAAKRAGSEIDKITKIGRRDSAKATMEASKAALESAKLDLEYCDVRAPIDGRITRNLVDVGNLEGAQGQPTVLATVVRNRPIYVSVEVNETDLLAVRCRRLSENAKLEPGQIEEGRWQPVDLAIGASAEYRQHGQVDYVDPALDPTSGTIHVRCRFENEDEFLLPGLSVRLRFPMQTVDAIVAPDIALLSDQAGRYALVVNDRDTVEIRRVKIGILEKGMRAVSEGLSTSDRIIVNGLQRARPGVAVRPVPAATPAAKPDQPGNGK
jgi:RND family efflux transporter MFP subunit